MPWPPCSMGKIPHLLSLDVLDQPLGHDKLLLHALEGIVASLVLYQQHLPEPSGTQG